MGDEHVIGAQGGFLPIPHSGRDMPSLFVCRDLFAASHQAIIDTQTVTCIDDVIGSTDTCVEHDRDACGLL